MYGVMLACGQNLYYLKYKYFANIKYKMMYFKYKHKYFICMYVCMQVCMYMYACMYACMYVCRYVCMYICMYVCIYVCRYVCMYICMQVCMYVCVYVRMYVCIYVCMYVCMNVKVFLIFINKLMVVMMLLIRTHPRFLVQELNYCLQIERKNWNNHSGQVFFLLYKV